MRVFEIAKVLNLSVKKAMALLIQNGFSPKNHMSEISENDYQRFITSLGLDSDENFVNLTKNLIYQKTILYEKSSLYNAEKENNLHISPIHISKKCSKKITANKKCSKKKPFQTISSEPQKNEDMDKIIAGIEKSKKRSLRLTASRMLHPLPGSFGCGKN